MATSDDWRSPEHRKSVVVKLQNWMSRYGNPTSKGAAEIEEQMFGRALAKEEYLNMVARLMLHIRMLCNEQGANNTGQDTLNAQSVELQNGTVDSKVTMSNANSLAFQPNVSSAPPNRTTLVSLPGGFVQPHQTVLPNTSQSTIFQGAGNTMQQPDNKASLQLQASTLSQPQLQRQRKQAGHHQKITAVSSAQPNTVPPANTTTQQSIGNPFNVQAKGMQAPAKPSPSPVGYSEPSPSAAITAASPLPAPGSAPSPLNPEDEQAYFEKIKMLSKYIEPLKEMISKIPNTEEHKVNRDKMTGLLDTLTQKRRVQPSALEKSEIVLERLLSSSLAGPSSAPQASTQGSSHARNTASASVPTLTVSGVGQLWPDMNALAPDPRLQMVARSTISPAMNVMNALTIGPPRPPSRKRKHRDEDNEQKGKVPHALKMEITNLLSRFQFAYQKTLITDQSLLVLSCRTRNKALPPLPPLIVKIPTMYPKRQPEYILQNYDSSPFLQNIKSSLKSKLLRATNLQPLTNILQAWEESVHEACTQEDLFAYIEEEKSLKF